MGNSYEEARKRLAGGGVQTQTPETWLTSYRATKKKKIRGGLDPFKDEEWQNLDKEYDRLTGILTQKDAERQETRAGGDEVEYKHRSLEWEALKQQRSLLRALQKSMVDSKRTEYAVQKGMVEPGKEEQAARYVDFAKDREMTLQEYVKDYGGKAQAIADMPMPGKGKMSDETLTKITDINRRLMQKDMTMQVLNAINNQGELLTRKDIKGTVFGKQIEKNLANRSELIKSAAQVTGATTPKQIEDILGKRPDEFVKKSWWDNRYNPLRQGFKVMQGAGGMAGGGLEALSASILDPDNMSPQMRDDTGFVDKYRKVPVLGQIGAFAEGWGRAFNDPWQGSPSKTATWMKEMSRGEVALPKQVSDILKYAVPAYSLANAGNPDPKLGLGFLRNKAVNPIAATAFDIVTDPLNLLSGAGALTGKGKSLMSLVNATDKAAGYVGAMETAKALPYLKRAENLALKMGKLKTVDDTAPLLSRVTALEDVAKFPRRADEAIREGYKVALSLRKPFQRERIAADLPDWLRSAEATAAKPFSGMMEAVRANPASKTWANMWNAQPFMTDEVLETKKQEKISKTLINELTEERARGIAPLAKNLPMEGNAKVDDFRRGLIGIEDLNDDERALSLATTVNNETDLLKEVDRGLMDRRLANYNEGVYADTGKRRLIDRLQGPFNREAWQREGQQLPPFKTYLDKGADPETIRVYEESFPAAKLKLKPEGLQVRGRFGWDTAPGTDVPKEISSAGTPFWPAAEKTVDSRAEAIQRFGPLYQTGIADQAMARGLTSITGRAEQGFLETLARRLGTEVPDATTEEGQALLAQMGNNWGKIKYKTGKRLPEEVPYYDDRGLKAAYADDFGQRLAAQPSGTDVNALMRSMNPKANRDDIISNLRQRLFPQGYTVAPGEEALGVGLGSDRMRIWQSIKDGTADLSDPQIAKMVDEMGGIPPGAIDAIQPRGTQKMIADKLRGSGLPGYDTLRYDDAGRVARSLDPQDLRFLNQYTTEPGDIRKAISQFRQSPKEIRGVQKELGDEMIARSQGLAPRGEMLGKATTTERLVPKDVLGYLKSQEPVNSVGERIMSKTFDPATNWWKGVATAWRPGFHGRNAISNLWQQNIAGMNPLDPQTWGSQGQAAEVVAGKGLDKVIDIPGMGQKSLGELKETARGLGMMPGGIYAENVMDTKRMLDLAETTLGHRMGQSLKKSYNPFSHEFPLTTAGRATGRGIENQSRVALWLENLKRTGDPLAAAEKTQKFLFDYSDLSRMERRGMRRVVPFWAWTRKNLPLQLEMMAKTPEKYSHLLRMQQASRESGLDEFGKEKIQAMEKFMPSFMKDQFSTLTPFSSGGNPLYFNPNLPFQDITKLRDFTKLFDPEENQNVLFNINPLLKLPLAMAFGAKSSIGGMPKGLQYASPRAGGALNAITKGINYIKPGADILPPASPAINKWNSMPSETVPNWYSFLLQNVPLMNDINQMLRTDKPDQAYQLLSRLAGVKFAPLDWGKEFESKSESEAAGLTDIIKNMNMQGTIDTKVDQFKPPALKAPPAAQTLYDFMLERGLPSNQQGYDRAKILYDMTHGDFGPGRWPTLEDIKMYHKVKVKMSLPSFDKRTGTWYKPSQKTLPEIMWNQ